MSVPESNLLGDLQRTHMVHKRVYVDSLQRVFQVMIIFITIITIVITFTKLGTRPVHCTSFPQGRIPEARGPPAPVSPERVVWNVVVGVRVAASLDVEQRVASAREGQLL